jgi:transglutaminase-like putative cysteine protease
MRAALNILSLAIALFAAHALMRGLLPEPLATIPVAIRGVLALVVLGLGIRGYSATRIASRNHQANVRRKPSWVDHTAAAGVLLALHFAFLWLLGAAPPVIERIGIAAEPWLRPEAAAKRVELAADANASGNWLWQDRRSRSLPQRTNLRPGNRPEVFLRFDTPSDASTLLGNSAYLSSFALSKFAGDRWTTPTTSPSILDADDDGITQFTTPSGRAAFDLIRHEVFHGVNTSGQNVLVSLQGLEEVEFPRLEQYDDGFLMLPSASENTLGFQYQAASRPLVLGNLPQSLHVQPQPQSPENLLELPENPRIADHLHDQTRAIVGENPTIRSLIDLETWIRDAFDYSLETTNPQNLDPLENFLFAERRGHCEHFAMTAALMLRSIGIPTRVAYGWAGGTWYGSSQLMVFRSREAHAWTELWLPDYGWIVMDPTPPAGINGTRSRVAPPDEKPPDPMDEWAEYDVSIDTTRIDLAAAWLLGIFGLPALVMLAMRRRIRGRFTKSGEAMVPGSIPTTGYLAAWCAACPPRHPGETLRQQIHRQATAPAFASCLIEYHYRIQYTPSRRSTHTERELEREIRKWLKERQIQHDLE